MRSKTDQVVWGAVFVGGTYLCLTYAAFVFSDTAQRKFLGREDGLLEWFGAFSFLAGAVLWFKLFQSERIGNHRSLPPTKRNYFYLVGALLFFLGAAEEISWGQRVFNLALPDYFAKHNIQQEFNLHNLEAVNGWDRQHQPKTGLARLLSANFLFNLFWFTFCVALPLVGRLSAKAAAWLRSSNLPVGPLWMAPLFLVNYATAKVAEQYFDASELGLLGEVKETNHEILLALVVWCLFQDAKRRRSLATPGSRSE